MDVTHHKSERTFKQCSVLKETLHVVNAAWEDLEQEGHIARTFNLWTQGLHTPPIMLSVPDIIARFDKNGDSRTAGASHAGGAANNLIFSNKWDSAAGRQIIINKLV